MRDEDQSTGQALDSVDDKLRVILDVTHDQINIEEARYLYDLTKRLQTGLALVNIGLYSNGSALCMALATSATGREVKSIDPHVPFAGLKKGGVEADDSIRLMRQPTGLGLSRNICCWNMTSQEAAQQWDKPVDIAFIDSDQRLEAVLHDIIRWKPFIRKGGVIAFHDAKNTERIDKALDDSFNAEDDFIEIAAPASIRAFRRIETKPEMILCAGLQSGGTTIISWCFLQHPELSGVLDMWTEAIQLMPYISTPKAWCKMTVSCFRWQEAAEIYGHMGWEVHPLLVVRDVREIYASLRAKPYGVNCLLGDEPPLRVRFRRFLDDWWLFRRNGWPIIRFESFLSDPEQWLRESCRRLNLGWSPDVVTWPKGVEEVGRVSLSNETFRSSLSLAGLTKTLKKDKMKSEVLTIPREDLLWLEETFAEYNLFHDYPSQRESVYSAAAGDRPKLHVSTRMKEQHRLWEALAARDASIAEKDVSIAEKDVSIAEKDVSIAEKDASIAEKDAWIGQIVNSWWWPLTAPVRRLRRRIKRS